MASQSSPDKGTLEFDELAARRRRLFYVFAVGRRSTEQRNTERYLRVFQRFDTQRGITRFLSWNWSAFFCTLPWLAYRRMTGLALLYFILAYVFAPIQIFAWQQNCPGEKGIPYLVTVGWLPFTFLLMPAIADWLYYRRARRIAIAASEKRYDNRIGTSASSAAEFAIGGSVIFLALFAVAGNYHAVSHEARLSQALQTVNAAKDEVAAFHAERGRLPRKGEIEPSAPATAIRSITVGDAGVITVVTGLRCFEGRSVVYTPAVANGRISWRCTTPDIDFSFLPAECRQRR